MSANILLLILPLLPLVSVVMCGIILKNKALLAAQFSIFISSLLTVCSIALLFSAEAKISFNWFFTGEAQIQLSLLRDNTSAAMGVLVCTVNLLVQIFSTEYMSGDKRYAVYYAWLGLFTASMLGIVLSDNLLLTFFSWELVGLSSYLLIGFWHEKPEPGPAARKAFLLNRVADIGFLSGMLILWVRFQSFSISELPQIISLQDPWVSLAGVLLVCGALGKSGQFPFQAWLPDAMAGPTPVSAMIHAATMVAAGVYFCVRIFPLLGEYALMLAGISGAITAVLAAFAALAQTDLKKILAYSTLSQLGFMMLAIGASVPHQALFHLFTHAFFKCGLFLAAAVIIHHRHQAFPNADEKTLQDIRQMKGLHKSLPFIAAVFLVFTLSLSGIPFFSGFLSKEGILYTLWFQANESVLNMLLCTAAFLTTFLTPVYMFGVVFRIFQGENHDKKIHLPRVFSLPLLVLAVLSLGWAFSPLFPWLIEESWFFYWISTLEIKEHTVWVPFLSISLSGFGIYLAWNRRNAELFTNPLLKYHFGLDALWEKGARTSLMFFAGIANFSDQKMIDKCVNLSADILVRPFSDKSGISLSRISGWTDRFAIDSMVKGIALSFRGIGWIFRFLQSGKTQTYLTLSFLMLIVLFLVLLIRY